MGIGKYQKEIDSRYFYVNAYRKSIKVLLVSVSFNILVFLITTLMYLKFPGRTYYSTNGIDFPMKLNPMSTPNYSAKPLLGDDLPKEKLPEMKF